MHDAHHVLRPRRALQPHGPLHELFGRDLAVAVVEHGEEALGLVRVELEGGEVGRHLRVLQKLLEFLKGDPAIARNICSFEDVHEFSGIGFLFVHLLLYHHLSVVGCYLQSVFQEQRRDDPRHREDDDRDVSSEEEGEA
eukprot:CAMPEP_0115379748 /NCGR_PEP_ID=MMETSP0271-20121206/4688_1 /TAXON_ID=71861 /ORGANISM="Scrippsiella trochoidea, Strain CCMP3099" /LENGTH=138 /DNA_ID=CAMNT_0002802953 /DNA_START=19 /DNA_END=435 /DNA_ORIENTATION=+